MSIFLVIVHYTAPLAEIDQALEDHRRWLNAGFQEGVFLLAGPQNPRRGGAIIAHGLDRAALDLRLAEDPFARAALARYEVVEVIPNKTDPRLEFLRTLG